MRDELLYKSKVGEGRRLLWRNLTRYREGTSCWWGPLQRVAALSRRDDDDEGTARTGGEGEGSIASDRGSAC